MDAAVWVPVWYINPNISSPLNPYKTFPWSIFSAKSFSGRGRCQSCWEFLFFMTICSLSFGRGKCWRTFVLFVEFFPPTLGADRQIPRPKSFLHQLFFSASSKTGGNLAPALLLSLASGFQCITFSLCLCLSGWYIIYRAAPFDENTSAVQLYYQMVKSKSVNLNDLPTCQD